MNEEIKMSDYFYLPVKSDGWDSISDKRGTLVMSPNFDGITDPIEHAISNHDRLVEENKSLREALKESNEVFRRNLSKYFYKDEVSMLSALEKNKQLLSELDGDK
jgi:hypothetical protein